MEGTAPPRRSNHPFSIMKSIQQIYTRGLWLLAALLMLATSAVGAEETTNARLDASKIVAGEDLLVRDNKWHYMNTFTTQWPNEFSHGDIVNVIQLGVDEQLSSHTPGLDFTVTVDFHVELTKMGQGYQWQTVNLPAQQLTVDYNPAAGTQYRQRDVLSMSEGLQVRVIIDNVSATNNTTGDPIAVPPAVYLEGEIRTERHYAFDLSYTPN